MVETKNANQIAFFQGSKVMTEMELLRLQLK